MKPHEHGGQVKRWKKEFGLKSDARILDFSANINPLGIPENVKEEIKKELDNLPNYPEPEAMGLCSDLAKLHGVSQGKVMVGNGASELIDLFFWYLKPKKVLQPAPTFREYERAALAVGSRIENFYIGDKPLNKNLEGFIDKIKEVYPDVVVICSPNNPTGELIDLDTIYEIAAKVKKINGWLLLDKSFISFVKDNWHEINWKIMPENVVLLYSFTKMYALAGLRLGYIIAPETFNQEMKSLRNPWSVNHLAQVAGRACLLEDDYQRKTRRLVEIERERLSGGFRNLGFDIFPGKANYLLVKVEENLFKKNGIDSELIWRELGNKGIFIRKANNFAGLDEKFFRVAVKLPEENDLLLSCIKDVLAKNT